MNFLNRLRFAGTVLYDKSMDVLNYYLNFSKIEGKTLKILFNGRHRRIVIPTEAIPDDIPDKVQGIMEDDSFVDCTELYNSMFGYFTPDDLGFKTLMLYYDDGTEREYTKDMILRRY